MNETEWNESREQEVGCEQRELTKEAAANHVGRPRVGMCVVKGRTTQGLA